MKTQRFNKHPLEFFCQEAKLSITISASVIWHDVTTAIRFVLHARNTGVCLNCAQNEVKSIYTPLDSGVFIFTHLFFFLPEFIR